MRLYVEEVEVNSLCRVSKADRLRSESPVGSVRGRHQQRRRRLHLVLVFHHHLRQQRYI